VIVSNQHQEYQQHDEKAIINAITIATAVFPNPNTFILES